jgi:hypothetical protein
MLGDWIDLPHLTVQGGDGGGTINTATIDLGANGKLLRLIVVGIDSFVKTNSDAPAHVVFWFQNIPGTHRMASMDWNYGGYSQSEMRHYLTVAFLRGLIAAGVPESVLYAPTRYIANGGVNNATAVYAIADWIWLPTYGELYTHNEFDVRIHGKYETSANQIQLEYCSVFYNMAKYDANGINSWWWTASAGQLDGDFYIVHYNEDVGYSGYNATDVGGIAPAFCVR